MRTGHDVKVGTFFACIRDQLQRCLLVVESDHQDLGVAQARFTQDIGTRRIAQKRFESKAAHDCYGFGIVIQHHRVEPACLHQTIDDLPEPSDSGNDDRTLFIDFIGHYRPDYAIHVFADFIVGNKQKRGNQH